MGNWIRNYLERRRRRNENGSNNGNHEDPNKPRSIRIVIVGASNVGKTCLIVNYNNGTFNEDKVPNTLDVFKGELEIDGRPVNIEIIDTSGDPHLA